VGVALTHASLLQNRQALRTSRQVSRDKRQRGAAVGEHHHRAHTARTRCYCCVPRLPLHFATRAGAAPPPLPPSTSHLRTGRRSVKEPLRATRPPCRNKRGTRACIPLPAHGWRTRAAQTFRFLCRMRLQMIRGATAAAGATCDSAYNLGMGNGGHGTAPPLLPSKGRGCPASPPTRRLRLHIAVPCLTRQEE